MVTAIKKGLDIPLSGAPSGEIHDAPRVSRVAFIGCDYLQVKTLPTLLVKPGDRVKMGQPLTRGKAYTSVLSTAPGSGVVEAIHRGPRRVVETVVIKLDDEEQAESFNKYAPDQLAGLSREQVREDLLVSGFWRALRTRPFSMVPNPEEMPDALFITATDTAPLAPDPALIIDQFRQDFINGVTVLSKLTEGKTWVCRMAGADVPVAQGDNIESAEFSGPHPAGLVGTHIHFLHPVDHGRQVWHIGYSDVISIGRLFTTGQYHAERIIGLTGPAAANPRLIRTRRGASTNELVANEIASTGDVRVVSGSVLNGRHAVGNTAFLGRFHNQLTLLEESQEREFFGWVKPGADKYSATNVFVSALNRLRKFSMNTAMNGSPRAMVPIGTYEKLMPLDILPTQLLRALIVNDTQTAEDLGALELDEEDLALCSFVDTGKHDFGPILRRNLWQIWREHQ